MNALNLPWDEVDRWLNTSGRFTRHVWFQGRVWFNPWLPLSHRGEMSLWSLREPGAGTSANPESVRNCTVAEEEAILAFTQ